jgi:raffinose/stachyose/melibiose transport system permease protein
MRSSLNREKNLWLTIFLAPPLLLMVVFTLLPALSAIGYSFFSFTSFNREGFVGLGNYAKLLEFPFNQQFLRALLNVVSVFFALMLVQNGMGLVLAYALWRQPKGFKFFRAVVFLPVILSLVVVGFLWRLLLDPTFGPINKFFSAIGLESFALAWLGDSRTALATLVVVNAWRWVGFPTLVFLAGMNAIPDDYYEAAKLDGATDGQMFRHITLPLLAPSFTILVILTFIGSMEWFELPYLMNGVTGSPAGATDTLVLMFYRLAFGGVGDSATDVGLAAAISVLLFVIVGIGSAFSALRLRRREVEL